MINYNINQDSYNNYCILVNLNSNTTKTNKQKNNFLCDFDHIIDSENKIVSDNNSLYYVSKIASLSHNSSFETDSEGKTTNESRSPDLTESDDSEMINSTNSSNLTSPTNSTNSTYSAKSTYSFGSNTSKEAERTFIQIPYNVQTSKGERVFLVSENNMFSLRGNVYGDLFILTVHGQVCWIRNSREYDTVINGPPILELSNYGELIFSINGQILFMSNKQFASNNYKLELTNSCELLVERTQTVIVNVDYYRRSIIVKQIQSIIYKPRNIYR